jgi:DNA-binding transcriptional LysR family regulator
VFPQRCNLNTYSLTYAGEINSINGAIDMVAGGLGMAVIPCHCVASLLEKERLYRHQASQPLLNDIHIITIKDHEYPRRVEQVIDWFFDMVADK